MTTNSHVDGVDWVGVVERALEGDRGEYARMARLVTGHLARWGAYDFRPDWDDMVQEVLISVLTAQREGRLDSSGAVRAFLRQAIRFKFIDRIRRSKRWKSDGDPEELGSSVHWPPETSIESDAVDLRLSLASAVDALPERERLAVIEVHVRGKSFAEAARSTGIPSGALKRAAKLGLARLRAALEGSG